MAGIWGDGQRGGIFGAKVDPRLVAELERRAVEKRQMAQGLESAAPAPSTIGSRAAEWWNNSTFFKPAYDELMGGLTAPGDVMSGAQPTMAADPQTGEFHTDPRLADRAMNAAGMLTLGAGAIPAEANSLRMGIKAYHGSPHDFERFDASKIGTGEGAQAYGHGLYLAENEAVAKEYRDNLSQDTWLVDGRPISKTARADTADGYAANALWRFQGDKQAAVRFLSQKGNLAAEKAGAKIIRNAKTIEQAPGRMYEVDIAAEPEHFLDWDKPLSEQSPQVREALASRLPQSRPADEIRAKIDALNSESQDLPLYSQRMTELMQERTQLERELQASGLQRDWLTGAKAYDLIGGGIHGQTDATDALREAGIPGIRYLDQGSRAKGSVVAGDGKPTGYHNIDQELANVHGGSWEAFKAAHPNPSPQLKAAIDDLDARGGVTFNREKGTSNYVVFDDKLISILKKYGLPASAAGLAALSQLHPQEAQAAQKKQKGR